VAARDPDRGRARRRAHARHLPGPPSTSASASAAAPTAPLAVAHSLLIAIWHVLQTGESYLDPGGDYYTRREPARTTRRLVAQLERHGHTVTLTEGAAG
jgi:hypothetical protein